MPSYDIDSLDNRDPAKMERAARIIDATLQRYHRCEVRGLDRIPESGALYVGNHNSGVYCPDTWLFATAAYHAHGLDAVPFGLAHEVVLQMPGINELLCPLGAVRASHENGERLLRAGRKVLVYPGGDVDAMRPYRDRDKIVFGGREGFIRLALRTGAPIVPIVAAGAHETLIILDDGQWLAKLLGIDRSLRMKVWPIALSLPWGLTVGPPPPFIPLPSRILIEVLEPITFDDLGPEAADEADVVSRCAEHVKSSMQAALDRLVGERRALGR